MNKIITAIGNQNINEKLKKEINIQVIGKDIQYQEGIFEILEKEINIDFLILSEKIVNEKTKDESNIIELIEKIKIKNKNLKIILILEHQKEDIENLLFAKGIYKIIYHNQIEIKDLIYLINKTEKNNENEQLKLEIDNLKKLIIENREINTKKENIKNNSKQNTNKNYLKKQFNSKIKQLISKFNLNHKFYKNQLNLESKNLNQKEIISVSGPSGAGKSIITVNLAKSVMYKKQKVLIIDFDILNNSIHTILGVKQYSTKIERKFKNNQNVISEKIEEFNVEDYIVKVNAKIDLISITNLLFDLKEKLNAIKIEKMLNKLKEKYNKIIIDTSSECFFDITKNIIKLSNKNIFVTETNILEIKKAKELLNIYIKEWKINIEKFNILFNKYDKNCINMNLLKCIFSDFNIIGFLKYNTKYNKLINKNIKNNFCDKKIRDEYMKIHNNI